MNPIQDIRNFAHKMGRDNEETLNLSDYFKFSDRIFPQRDVNISKNEMTEKYMKFLECKGAEWYQQNKKISHFMFINFELNAIPEYNEELMNWVEETNKLYEQKSK